MKFETSVSKLKAHSGIEACTKIFTLTNSISSRDLIYLMMRSIFKVLQEVQKEKNKCSKPQISYTLEGGTSQEYLLEEEKILYRVFLYLGSERQSTKNSNRDKKKAKRESKYAYVMYAWKDNTWKPCDSSSPVFQISTYYTEDERTLRINIGDITIFCSLAVYYVNFPW